MAKTQYFTAASLDGFIADSGNSLDWLFQAEATAKAESASGDLYHEFYAQVGALAMGATTYEWVLRHEQMLAAAGGRNTWLVGGGDLVGQFVDHGLLDEMIISIAPATLGSGAPLLPRRLLPGELTLTRCVDDGTFVHLSYAVSRPGR